MLKSRNNMQVVRVDMTEWRVFAKFVQYVMLAIIHGCCVQSEFILNKIAKRLLKPKSTVHTFITKGGHNAIN